MPPSAAASAGRRHRAGDADLALAADLGAGDRGVLLVQDADRRGGQQEVARRRRRSRRARSARSSAAPPARCRRRRWSAR